MSSNRVAPTRANLLRARRDLARVERGVALTRKKREALVVELFRIARPAVTFRTQLADAVTTATESLAGALALHGTHGLHAMSYPEREPTVDLTSEQVWGVWVADIANRSTVPRSVDARGVAPSLTGPSTADAARKFELLVEMLIDAAPREQRMRRLGIALAQTNRRLRLLEQRIAPRLSKQIRAVRTQLEESEREAQLRLRVARRSSSRVS